MPKFDKSQKNMSLSKQRNMAENAEIGRLKAAYPSCEPKICKTFADMPLSSKTMRGLSQSTFKVPTNIQRQSIPLALKGSDILGAAKTGSGKTLAFVIPTLEKLFITSWSHFDGCGVLIVTPTRELAAQIFEVLRTVGRYHSFSAGVVIGGKSLKDESQQIRTTNIIICTPGRLRQHMEETYNFELTNLQMLVLDEADRMLDMGFKRDMDIIIENMPDYRQTLLFSATQTKSLNDLVRLSLNNPVFVSVHELSEHSTPDDLKQSYLICEQFDKLNILFSFIKTHLQQKTLVFVSTCKQVKYIFAAFCKLRPGTSVLALHGELNQMKRIGVYQDFCKKQRGILLATDVAARGLDFPGINWVVQMDCPDSAESYIHRVGRTARFEKGGQALLFLLPSEKSMLEALEKRRIPITGIKTNPKQVWNIDAKMQSLCASDIEMKGRAQRSFVSYMRSTYLMPDKNVFDTEAIDLERFAKSLGLANAPSLKFSKSETSKFSRKLVKEAEKVKKIESMKFNIAHSDDDDLLVAKVKPDSGVDIDESSEDEKVELPKRKVKALSKMAEAKKALSKKLTSNKRIVFDDDGGTEKKGSAGQEESDEDEEKVKGSKFDFQKALMKMSKADKLDKQEWRKRIKVEHRRKRLAERQRQRELKGGDRAVTLADKDGGDDERKVDSGSGVDSGSEFDMAEAEFSGSDAEENIESEDDALSSENVKRRRIETSENDEDLALQLLRS